MWLPCPVYCLLVEMFDLHADNELLYKRHANSNETCLNWRAREAHIQYHNLVRPNIYSGTSGYEQSPLRHPVQICLIWADLLTRLDGRLKWATFKLEFALPVPAGQSWGKRKKCSGTWKSSWTTEQTSSKPGSFIFLPHRLLLLHLVYLLHSFHSVQVSLAWVLHRLPSFLSFISTHCSLSLAVDRHRLSFAFCVLPVPFSTSDAHLGQLSFEHFEYSLSFSHDHLSAVAVLSAYDFVLN